MKVNLSFQDLFMNKMVMDFHMFGQGMKSWVFCQLDRQKIAKEEWDAVIYVLIKTFQELN